MESRFSVNKMGRENGKDSIRDYDYEQAKLWAAKRIVDYFSCKGSNHRKLPLPYHSHLTSSKHRGLQQRIRKKNVNDDSHHYSNTQFHNISLKWSHDMVTKQL